jgi:hypothetical protein
MTPSPASLANLAKSPTHIHAGPDARTLILAELQRRTLTAYQAADLTGRSTQTVYYLLKQLRTRRQAHIADWVRRRQTGEAQAVWQLGQGEDAPRPAPMNNTLKSARRRAKQRSLPQGGSFLAVLALQAAKAAREARN